MLINNYFKKKYFRQIIEYHINNPIRSQNVFLVTSKVLDVFDSLNQKRFDEEIDIDVNSYINDILDENITYQQIVDDGYMDDTQGFIIRKLKINLNSYSYTFDSANNKHLFSIILPIEVQKGFYRNENDGTTDSELFIAFFTRNPINYLKGRTDTNHPIVVPQSSYFALSLVETGQDGAIHVDHTDKIEYIDSLKFNIINNLAKI